MIVRVPTADHHSTYLEKTVAVLTPEGVARVDELLAQLAQAAGGRPDLLEFARARKVEADIGSTDHNPVAEPQLTEAERNALLAGFMTIRDRERMDDVADWANAVIALLEDEAGYEGAI
jgi:hypothetical protein